MRSPGYLRCTPCRRSRRQPQTTASPNQDRDPRTVRRRESSTSTTASAPRRRRPHLTKHNGNAIDVSTNTRILPGLPVQNASLSDPAANLHMASPVPGDAPSASSGITGPDLKSARAADMFDLLVGGTARHVAIITTTTPGHVAQCVGHRARNKALQRIRPPPPIHTTRCLRFRQRRTQQPNIGAPGGPKGTQLTALQLVHRQHGPHDSQEAHPRFMSTHALMALGWKSTRSRLDTMSSRAPRMNAYGLPRGAKPHATSPSGYAPQLTHLPGRSVAPVSAAGSPGGLMEPEFLSLHHIGPIHFRSNLLAAPLQCRAHGCFLTSPCPMGRPNSLLLATIAVVQSHLSR